MTPKEKEIYTVLVERPEIMELFEKIFSIPSDKRQAAIDNLKTCLRMLGVAN